MSWHEISLWNNLSNYKSQIITCSYSSLYSWYLIFSPWQKIGKEIKLWAFNFYLSTILLYISFINKKIWFVTCLPSFYMFKIIVLKNLCSVDIKWNYFHNRIVDIDWMFFCFSTFAGNQNRRYFHHHHQPHLEQILHFGSENQEQDVQKDDGLYVSVWRWYLLF